MSSDAEKLPTIISVKEFRKFAGKDADKFTDDQIVDLINGLDFIAGLFIKQAIKSKEAGMS